MSRGVQVQASFENRPVKLFEISPVRLLEGCELEGTEAVVPPVQHSQRRARTLVVIEECVVEVEEYRPDSGRRSHLPAPARRSVALQNVQREPHHGDIIRKVELFSGVVDLPR